MKSKVNILLIGVAAAIVVVIAVAGFLLFRGIGQYAEADKKLTRSVAALRNFYARDPFPSAENIGREEENVKVLRTWFGRFVGALREGEIAPVQKTPSTFISLLSGTCNDLQHLAKQNGTKVDPGFAFGFGRYAASAALPAPPDVPRLTQQLAIMEQVCRILFIEKARALERVQRDEFEDTPVPAAGESTDNRRLARLAAAGGGAAGEVTTPAAVRDAGILKPGALYAKMHFQVVFKAGEKELFGILNQLARHNMFAVVTLVDIEKEKNDVTVPERRAVAVSDGAGALEGAATNAPAAVAAAPSRRERLVSGPVVQPPMTVRLELDVYRFAEPPAESGSGA